MIESYHSRAGSQGWEKEQRLIIATLNYCDIMNNPFEFYCQEFQKELEQLSDIFVSLIPNYLPFTSTTFAWKMGKIDQKIRIGRYSPAFDPEAGIQHDRFVSRQEFEQIWDHRFNQLPQVKNK